MTLEVDLSREIEDGLAKLAAGQGRAPEELAAEAVNRFVRLELDETATIEHALAEARAGHVVPHEDVMADVDRLLRDGTVPR